jgi:two-component system chemotaxis response regulator CheB
MTGNSVDGAEGLKSVKEKEGITIVQDPKDANAELMPKSAILAANPDYVIPLPDIGTLLMELSEETRN